MLAGESNVGSSYSVSLSLSLLLHLVYLGFSIFPVSLKHSLPLICVHPLNNPRCLPRMILLKPHPQFQTHRCPSTVCSAACSLYLHYSCSLAFTHCVCNLPSLLSHMAGGWGQVATADQDRYIQHCPSYSAPLHTCVDCSMDRVWAIMVLPPSITD